MVAELRERVIQQQQHTCIVAAEDGSSRSRNSSNSNSNSNNKDDGSTTTTATEKKRKRRIVNSGMIVTSSNEARMRWRLLSIRDKFLTAIILTVLTVHLVTAVLDVCFHYYGPGRSDGTTMTTLLKTAAGNTKKNDVDFLSSDQRLEHFAVIINTYRRPDMLKDAVVHYADTCGRRAGVHQVFVVWADLQSTPPSPESFFETSNYLKKGTATSDKSSSSSTIPEHRATVEIVTAPVDSLNSRFLPLKSLDAAAVAAVFMSDDDIFVRCDSLVTGFWAWRHNPDTQVGFYARLAAPPQRAAAHTDLDYVYNPWPTVAWRRKINFVLTTKAAFFHSRYLSVYSAADNPVQERIRAAVDDHFNCEDIAMAMIIANATKHAISNSRSSDTDHGDSSSSKSMPVYVQGRVWDRGLLHGISTSKSAAGGALGVGHLTERSYCLTNFSRWYVQAGWGAPLATQYDLQAASWLHHSPGFWWQFQPSNFFEWFAVQNIFV